MSDLVKRLREHLDINFNHESGLIPISTQIKVIEAADRIEELEREVAAMTAQAGAEALYSDGLRNQLAEEKALTDQLAKAAEHSLACEKNRQKNLKPNSPASSYTAWRIAKIEASLTSYRKARGM